MLEFPLVLFLLQVPLSPQISLSSATQKNQQIKQYELGPASQHCELSLFDCGLAYRQMLIIFENVVNDNK